MRPGEVKSDKQAFEQILRRLKGDVGTLLDMVDLGIETKRFANTAPFWALARMMFPIAESIGDLIYRGHAGSNLVQVLANEFEAVRPGYRDKAATIALLFRHSLVHTDELRTIELDSKLVGWGISLAERERHLQIDRRGFGFFRLQFDTTAFYDDLLQVLQKELERDRGGEVMARYNSWLTHRMDDRNATEKAARREIESWTVVCPLLAWLGLQDYSLVSVPPIIVACNYGTT